MLFEIRPPFRDQQGTYEPCEVANFYHLHMGHLLFNRASLVAQVVKNLPAMHETSVWSLGWEDFLEEGMATYSSILAWRIPRNGGGWRATVHGVAKNQIWQVTQQQPHNHFAIEAALQNRDQKIQTLLSPFFHGWWYTRNLHSKSQFSHLNTT